MNPFPIPPCTWSRPFGQPWSQPYRVRYASNLDDGPNHGMPLGGFGAGCLGRSPQGDFNLWHLDGGEHLFRALPACQFSVFEQVEGQSPQAYALGSPPTDGTLGLWQWYPQGDPGAETENVAPGETGKTSETGKTGTYHALYPRSWFVYQGVLAADLTCGQFSPILPHNYRETSFPLALFEWTAHNPHDRPLTLSLLLTWHNSVGWFTNTCASPEITIRDDGSPVYHYVPAWGESTGNWNESVESTASAAGIPQGAKGLVMDRLRDPGSAVTQEGQGQWAIAVPLAPDLETQTPWEVFTHSRWNPAGDGGEIWRTFAQDGSLVNLEDHRPAAEGEQVAVAVAVRFTLAPGASLRVPFALAWDFPITEFAQGIQGYRRYTDFWGRQGNQAWNIALEGLRQGDTWQAQIQAWQAPILARSAWPHALKMALWNELYLLTDGGSLWSAATPGDPVGQFGVLECLDYAWYESLDVRLYGSFGLLSHWPDLEKAVIRAFARAIPQADPRPRIIGYYVTLGQGQHLAPRKLANATPHDLGAPNEHPWEKTNYTAYQDCNLWKDLASDFVLQVYRDFYLTGGTDWGFVGDCWPAVVAALDYLKGFDLDGDGIPENSGAPDQTFDDWRLQGISAYCGGLWIAALEAAIALGQGCMADPDRWPQGWDGTQIQGAIDRFGNWLHQSRPLYQATLWNGRYYRLDSASGSDVVMADQLCGQFYSRLLGLPDVVPLDCARSALDTVYQTCFLGFHQGQWGAANGLRPDSSPVNPQDTHPLEVWTGINFGLAAFLVQMGQDDRALHLAETVIHQIYHNGLQFRTPEAITAQGTFRASHYLRAMAIWAIATVWDQTHPPTP